MKINHHPATSVYLLNVVGLHGICISLGVASYYQYVLYELPCPLCLLQRVGLIIAGFGFLFNFCFGLRGAHYSMVILGSILTGIMATRQILLHIMPGDTGYGSALLGLHFYTWDLIISVLLIATAAGILAIRCDNCAPRSSSATTALFRIAGWLFIILISLNLISTVVECGGGQCADNPVKYELLSD